MKFIRKLFGKKEKNEEIKEERFLPPEVNYKNVCEACGDGIDPSLHKWTKHQGKYFHKVCWNNALKMAARKGII